MNTNSKLRALTFDCYGTLIDWRGGAHQALRELVKEPEADLDQLIRDWLEIDEQLIAGPYRDYSEILAQAIQQAAARQDLSWTAEQSQAFAQSQARWPAFAESKQVLDALAQQFELAILSNVETATLQSSCELLGGQIKRWVTAQEIQSYKPAPAHFETALERFGWQTYAAQGQVLHVAQSVHHDLRTATGLGWSCAWINRLGEPRPADLCAGPPVALNGPAQLREFPDLASLARELGTL